MIYLLIFGCLGLLIFSYFIFHGSISNPSFIIILGFLLSSVNLLQNQSIWQFNDEKTVFIVLGGLLSFEIASGLVFSAYKKRRIIGEFDIQFFNLNLKLILYLTIQILTYIAIIIIICKMEGQSINSIHGISVALSSYHQEEINGNVSLPSWINWIYILLLSGNYLIIYFFDYLVIKKNKISIILKLNIILILLGSLVTGNKTNIIMYLLALAIDYIILQQKYLKKLNTLNIKKILIAIVIIFLSFNVFKFITTIQGRTVNGMDPFYNFSTYLGAPLKNFEIFITKQDTVNIGLFGSQTFKNSYEWLTELTGNAINIPNLYTYNWINGLGLGNVYSIYQQLYNDFGIIGSIFFMFLLGSFSTFIYCFALFKNNKSGVSFWLIYYSYLANALFLSYFSNKIGESIFARASIYFLIGLFIFYYFFVKVNNTSKH